MQTDEEQIRELVAAWMRASKAGDVEAVLELMTEDIVFLVPAQAPMGKRAFAEAAKAQSGPSAPKIEGVSDIREIKVLGEWAFMWTQLSVVVSPADGSAAIERAGHTLSVLRKERGKWLLARDANLLTLVQKAKQ